MELESAFGEETAEMKVYFSEPHEYWGDRQVEANSLTVVPSVWTGDPKDSHEKAILIE